MNKSNPLCTFTIPFKYPVKQEEIIGNSKKF